LRAFAPSLVCLWAERWNSGWQRLGLIVSLEFAPLQMAEKNTHQEGQTYIAPQHVLRDETEGDENYLVE
jgi:hypothetical protein